MQAPPQLSYISRQPINSSRLTIPIAANPRAGTPTPTTSGSTRLARLVLGTHARRAVRRQLAECAGIGRSAPAIGHGTTPLGWQLGEALGHGGRDSGRGMEWSGAHWALGYMGERARIVLSEAKLPLLVAATPIVSEIDSLLPFLSHVVAPHCSSPSCTLPVACVVTTSEAFPLHEPELQRDHYGGPRQSAVPLQSAGPR